MRKRNETSVVRAHCWVVLTTKAAGQAVGGHAAMPCHGPNLQQRKYFVMVQSIQLFHSSINQDTADAYMLCLYRQTDRRIDGCISVCNVQNNNGTVD